MYFGIDDGVVCLFFGLCCEVGVWLLLFEFGKFVVGVFGVVIGKLVDGVGGIVVLVDFV